MTMFGYKFSVRVRVYIYIYIYCNLLTEMFRCNATLQCRQTHLIIRAGIETRLTLCQSLLCSTYRNREHTYCHPLTDFLVVSQLFNVARFVICFNLGSKPDWLYVRAIVFLSIGERIFTYIFLQIHYRLHECSILGKRYCILAYG